LTSATHVHETGDHRTIIGRIASETRRDLTTRSDLAGVRHAAIHFGLVGACAVTIAAEVPFWWALLPVQGILIVFLFTALHETIHETAFASPRLNRAVASVSGFLNLLGPAWFRPFHLAHHRHTQDPEHDPELAAPKPETWVDYLKHLSGLPVWFGNARTLLRNARGTTFDDFVPSRARARLTQEARAYLALYALLLAGSVAAGSMVLVWIWIAPALLGQPFLRAYLLAEHGRCPEVANMFENTRTTFTNTVVRFIAWNMPYHTEHHAYPTVPFHRLPDLHRLVEAELLVTERGYGRFHARNAPAFR